MFRSLLAGAVLLAIGASTAQSQAPADSVVEPTSRRAFPTTIAIPGGGASHVLMGTAIRTRTFLRVQVYAYGLYVDSGAARRILAPWRGKAARDLERDESFYAALLRDSLPKTMRLHMTRDVGGGDMAEAFDGALGPRVDRAAERGLAGGRAALQRFRGYFQVGELTKETVLTFSCLPGGRLLTAVGGELKEPIESAALCWALFDVYLGENPIMERGKRTVVERAPEVLR